MVMLPSQILQSIRSNPRVGLLRKKGAIFAPFFFVYTSRRLLFELAQSTSMHVFNSSLKTSSHFVLVLHQYLPETILWFRQRRF